MAKEIVYSTQPVSKAGGRVMKNPQFFVDPDKTATMVYVDPEWKKVVEGYKALKITVKPLSELKADDASKPASSKEK